MELNIVLVSYVLHCIQLKLNKLILVLALCSVPRRTW